MKQFKNERSIPFEKPILYKHTTCVVVFQYLLAVRIHNLETLSMHTPNKIRMITHKKTNRHRLNLTLSISLWVWKTPWLKNVKKKLRQQIDAIWFQYRSVNRICSEYRIKTMVFGVSAVEIQEVLQSATKTKNVRKKTTSTNSRHLVFINRSLCNV